MDLACGTGAVFLLAKEAVGESGTVTGIDISHGMIAVAKEKVEKQGLHIDFIQHDVTELNQLREKTIKGDYDLITCITALTLIQNQAQVIREWVALLKPGGRFMADVPTENTLVVGLIFEEIGANLRITLPYH